MTYERYTELVAALGGGHHAVRLAMIQRLGDTGCFPAGPEVDVAGDAAMEILDLEVSRQQDIMQRQLDAAQMDITDLNSELDQLHSYCADLQSRLDHLSTLRAVV